MIKEYVGFKWEGLTSSQKESLYDKACELGYRSVHEFILDNLNIKYVDSYYCLCSSYFDMDEDEWWTVWSDNLENAIVLDKTQLSIVGVMYE